jgi:hypothetical protein
MEFLFPSMQFGVWNHASQACLLKFKLKKYVFKCFHTQFQVSHSSMFAIKAPCLVWKTLAWNQKPCVDNKKIHARHFEILDFGKQNLPHANGIYPKPKG